jgi:hypothetical protein
MHSASSEDEGGPPVIESVSAGFQRLFDYHVVSFADKQQRFADLVEGRDWEYRVEEGVLHFPEAPPQKGYAWKAEILGTQSELSNSWLWSWANEASELPPAATVCARKLKQFGEKHGIKEFTMPTFQLGDELDGQAIVAVSVGLTKAGACFLGGYENGAAYLLITDPAYENKQPYPLLHIATMFTQVLGQWSVSDHRRALVGYASSYGLQTSQEGSTVKITHPSGESLIGSFNKAGHLEQIQSTFSSKSK